jgi:hypothetical protein
MENADFMGKFELNGETLVGELMMRCKVDELLFGEFGL